MAGKGGARKGAGRKKGKTGKAVGEIRELIDQVSKEQGVRGLKGVIQSLFERAQGSITRRDDGTVVVVPPSDPAARLLLEFKFGRPKETLDLSSQGHKIAAVGVVVPAFIKERNDDKE